MGPDAMILVFWMLSFKPTFSLSSFTFIKRLFSSSSLSAIRVVSSAYLRLLLFLPGVLIPDCASCSPAFLMMYSAHKLNKQGDNIQPFHTGEFWGPEEWSDLLVGGKGRLWIQVILLQSQSCFHATCGFFSKKRKIWQPRTQVMGIQPGFDWAGWSRKWTCSKCPVYCKQWPSFCWIHSPNILNFTLGHLVTAENLVELGVSTLFTTKLWSYRSISGGASCSALCAQVWERSPEPSEQLWL